MDFHDDSDPVPKTSVFVFGSNLAGRHGAGGAKYALKYHGAIYGQAEGLMGSDTEGWCYGIPTRNDQIVTLPLDVVTKHIMKFRQFAEEDLTDRLFWLTRVGCGLAGYNDSQIAPLFRGAYQRLPNVNFPKLWKPYLLP